MNNNCASCGIEIPDGQKFCSMCYGDIDYGKDGYYRRWTEEQMEENQREQDEREHYQRGLK
jgi:hypothetical protein